MAMMFLSAISACSLELVGLGDATWSRVEPGQDAVLEDERTASDVVRAEDLFELPELVADSPVADGVETDAWVPLCQADSDCDDQLDCTHDRCENSQCLHVPDDMACPAMDGCFTYHCVPQSGCQPLVLAGDPCVVVDKCVIAATCDTTGACVPDTTVHCKSSPCMESHCDPGTGECIYKKLTGDLCDDGSPCTVDDTCLDGVCKGVVDQGACLCALDEECAEFGVGSLCAGKLVCSSGHCVPDANGAVVCPLAPPNACFEWACDPTSGQCVKLFLELGTGCSDGNSCTKSDHCEGGVCVGAAVPDDSPCNLDLDSCTQDVCLAGVCSAGPDKQCAPQAPCATAVCDPLSGKCVVVAQEAVPCDDLDPCTVGESCLWGQCQGGLWVCVDCNLPEMNGRPCDDGKAQTVGDFCFAGACAGFRPAQMEGMVLGPVASVGVEADWVHVVGNGFSAQGNAPPLPGIADLTWMGVASSWAAVGADPLTDVAGPVAVGKPGQVYFRGMSWTGNNGLRVALQAACPGFGVTSKPLSVVTVGNDALVGTVFDKGLVVVGFEATAEALVNGCVVAACSMKEDLAGWTCSRLPLEWPGGTANSDGMKIRISAMDCDVGGPCSGIGGPCVQAVDLVAAYELTKPGSSEWGVVEGLLKPAGAWEWTVLLGAQGGAVGGAGPASAVDVGADGSLVVVGAQGMLYSRGAQEATGSLKPLPWDSSASTPNLTGVLVGTHTTLVLANALPKSSMSNPSQIVAGFLAGAPGWPFQQVPEGVSFVPVRQFASCPTCGTWSDLAAGLRDVGQRPTSEELVLIGSVRTGVDLVGEVLFLSQ